jgi:hypothetical protein
LPYKFKLGLHIITGILILILTIAFIAIVGGGGGDTHTKIGNILEFVTFVISGLGLVNWGIKVFAPNKFWNFFRCLQITFLHKYLGYALIIFS